MRHGAPRVVGGRGLRVPDVTGVASELSGLQGLDDVLLDRDLRTRGVHDVRAATHRVDQVRVEQMVSLRVQRGVDVHDVDRTHQRLHVGVVDQAKLLLDLSGQPASVEVMQPHVEGFQPAQHSLADAARRDDADVKSLKVIGALHAVGDVPAAVDHPLM
ncbi:Uncharacterised protein [Mycobacteroides abscessus subsp. abscessus]|nr:Uncharacterised protein [Mycobacteroides abscessus subsp. abscessus]